MGWCRLQANQDLFEERVENGINTAAHVDGSFHVPAVEVTEGTRNVFGDLFHAVVDADATVKLLLLLRSGRRVIRVAAGLEVDKVATTTVHGGAEGWEDDCSAGGDTLSFRERASRLSIVGGRRGRGGGSFVHVSWCPFGFEGGRLLHVLQLLRLSCEAGELVSTWRLRLRMERIVGRTGKRRWFARSLAEWDA
jgi:rhodanese-related sulfurtransferase